MHFFSFAVYESCLSSTWRNRSSRPALLRFAMWRLDSPLRSHRPCWPQYQHAYSGLNKSLFASAGPNSLQRGHQQSKTLDVADGPTDKRIRIFTEPNPVRSRSPARRDICSEIHFAVCYGTVDISSIPPYIVVCRFKLHCRINQHFLTLRSSHKTGPKC